MYIGGQLWDIHRVGHLDLKREADCVIVLGAAAWHDKPSPVLRERLNHAIHLHQNGAVRSLVLTGGYGKGADFAESEVGLEYCVKQGVPRDAIHAELESLNTLDNLKEAKVIMAEKGFEHAVLSHSFLSLPLPRGEVEIPLRGVRALSLVSHHGEVTLSSLRFYRRAQRLYHGQIHLPSLGSPHDLRR